MPQTRPMILSAAVAMLLGFATWALLPAADRGGEPVAAAPPGRVISLSPALTEIVYALGAGETLVGVSDFCNYPAATAGLPRCGGQINPNLEQIVSLQPDLVLFQGEHETVREHCQRTGQRCWAHRLDNLDDLLAVMRELGAVLGRPEAGAAAAQRLAAELAALRATVAARPPAKVFVCVGRQPDRIAGITTCGGGSFLDELITLAGGANVFGDLPILYPQPSLEAIVERQPAVILDLQPELGAASPQALTEVVAEWSILEGIPAVTDHRVIPITADFVLIPGPRIVDATRIFAAALHPELAGALQKASLGEAREEQGR